MTDFTVAEECLKDIDVVILAGGLGTRLASVLADRPKVLAAVGDRPYLAFLLDWLKRFGACRIIFGLGHLAGSVASYLEVNKPDGVDIETIVEQQPLGTGGAIANLRSAIRSDPALILNGDSFIDADLCKFLASHRKSGADSSILCTDVPDTSRFGSVLIGENDRIIEFQEKQPGRGPGSINAGIYLFGPDMLEHIMVSGPSLENDVFQKLPAGTLHAMNGKFTFLDIGTPEDLARAPKILKPFMVE